METEELIFDTERFDAEIKLERALLPDYSTRSVAQLLGVHKETVLTALGRGNIPAPLFPAAPGGSHCWTRDQVLDIMMSPTRPSTVQTIDELREHGTLRGGRQHYRLREPLCDECRPITRAHMREANKRSRDKNKAVINQRRNERRRNRLALTSGT